MIKKIVLSSVALATLGLSAAALADAHTGYYVTAQMGRSTTQIADDSSTDGAITNNASGESKNGLAARIAAGYDFNENVALEFGLARYATSELDVVSTTSGVLVNTQTITMAPRVADLLVKGNYDINADFFVYGKAGIAFVATTFDTNSVGYVDVSGKEDKNFYRPEMAVGAGYNIKENVAVDASYSRIFGKGNFNDLPSYLPNLDLASVGLTYKF